MPDWAVSHAMWHDILVVGAPVAEKVLRKALCPVMTVCHVSEAVAESGPPFRTILCALDFQAPSSRARDGNRVVRTLEGRQATEKYQRRVRRHLRQ